MSSKILAIVNPRASRCANEDPATLLQEHLPGLELVSTEGADDLVGFIRAQIARHGPDRLVTCGGDGTVSATITACAGSSIPVGILPGGTANVFAKEVGIPFDYEDACAVIAAGHSAAFDANRRSGSRISRRTSSCACRPLNLWTPSPMARPCEGSITRCT